MNITEKTRGIVIELRHLLDETARLSKEWREEISKLPLEEAERRYSHYNRPSPLAQVMEDLYRLELDVLHIICDCLTSGQELTHETLERVRALESLFHLVNNRIRYGDVELLMFEWKRFYKERENRQE